MNKRIIVVGTACCLFFTTDTEAQRRGRVSRAPKEDTVQVKIDEMKEDIDAVRARNDLMELNVADLYAQNDSLKRALNGIKAEGKALRDGINALKQIGNNKGSGLELSMSTMKTVLKDKALNLGISYLKKIGDRLDGNSYVHMSSSGTYGLMVTPDLDIEAGTADAFSSITAKMTGLALVPRWTTVDEIPTPDLRGSFMTIPFSIGLETNSRFNFVNGLGEAGIGWWIRRKRKDNENSVTEIAKIGLFVQGGYKFSTDNSGKLPIGGEVDQSEEDQDDAIFRVKGMLKVDSKALIKIKGVGLGVAGNATGWYDILNAAIYHRLEGKLRIYLTDSEDQYFDFEYQKGSGAPNFNEGEQFGAGLTVAF